MLMIDMLEPITDEKCVEKLTRTPLRIREILDIGINSTFSKAINCLLTDSLLSATVHEGFHLCSIYLRIDAPRIISKKEDAKSRIYQLKHRNHTKALWTIFDRVLHII